MGQSQTIMDSLPVELRRVFAAVMNQGLFSKAHTHTRTHARSHAQTHKRTRALARAHTLAPVRA